MNPLLLTVIPELIRQIGITTSDPIAPPDRSIFGDDKNDDERLENMDIGMDDVMEDISPQDVVSLIEYIPSDEDLKDIINPRTAFNILYKNQHQFTPREIKFIMSEGDFDKDTNHAHNWRGDVLDGYIKHIKNYVYNYNDEAKKLDPSIDTEKEHIGPTAQAVEKVNPAAVITDDATGYKSVDTGRLALMNAGAIGDLARKVKSIEAKL